MSLLATALQPSLTSGLLDVQDKDAIDVPALLTRNSGFYPSYKGGVWTLDFMHHEPVARAMAGECARLACAAFQTFRPVEKELLTKDVLPWCLVKSYYAAFYAGHSILRAMGCSCSYLQGQRLHILQKIVGTYGIQPVPPKGLHAIETVAGTGQVTLTNVPKSGAHEGFWYVFHRVVTSVSARILSKPVMPTADAQRAWGALSSFLGHVSRNGGHVSWLSELRNSIQYRQEKDVWFPASPSRRHRESLARIASTWVKKPEEISLASKLGEVGQLLSACAFMVALCRELLLRIASRSNVRTSFAAAGPLRLLSTAA